MAVHEGMAPPSQTSHEDGMDGMAGPKAISIRMCWISLLHSLWSTQIVHLLHRLSTSYSIVYRISIAYPLVTTITLFYLIILYITLQTTALVYLALVQTKPREV